MKSQPQLDFFQAHLPAKPYHTDDLACGLRIAAAKRAIKSKYIQPNGATHRWWVVFDIDKPTATVDWCEANAPAPNIIATNAANGHAHLLYGLETSIRTAPDGRAAPLRYAAAVESALRERLQGDEGYTGLICKNPLHAFWRVSVWQSELYTLDWLADYLDLSPYAGIKRLPDYGLGRNCNLFEYLSGWSYKAYRQGYPDLNRWFQACLERATWYNRRFRQPLPDAEVRHTAWSVAKWVFKHFSPSGFSERQARCGAIGGKISKGGGRPSLNAPWFEMGISRATYFRRKNTAPQLCEPGKKTPPA